MGARNFFNFDGTPKNPFHNNQFGGSLGGPIVRDKTFFYFNYEGQTPKSVESNQPYPGGAIKYLGLLEEQRAAGAVAGLETAPRTEKATA